MQLTLLLAKGMSANTDVALGKSSVSCGKNSHNYLLASSPAAATAAAPDSSALIHCVVRVLTTMAGVWCGIAML